MKKQAAFFLPTLPYPSFIFPFDGSMLSRTCHNPVTFPTHLKAGILT
ncbi:hypothetical protein [Sellimonas intestinalis]